MYEHEIRWWTLVPTAILAGFLVLFAETGGLWFRFPARPDWFWCIAVLAALKAPPAPAVAVFGCMGLLRDLILGPRPGSAMLAFVLVGWPLIRWLPFAAVRGLAARMFMTAAAAFPVALVKHALDYGSATHKLWYWLAAVSLGDAVLTLLAYPLVVLLLSPEPFRPWRERNAFFY